MQQAYLYDAIRTPFGKLGGSLSGHRPDDLAAHVIRELVARAPQLDASALDEVIFGNATGPARRTGMSRAWPRCWPGCPPPSPAPP